MVIIGFGLATLLGVLLYRVFGSAIRFEIPGGYRGWLVARWDDQGCLPLPRQGMFLVVRFSSTGLACTSTQRFANLTYLRFEYVFLDGTRQSLRWNAHGKPGTQAWLAGYSLKDRTDDIFVGDEEALNHSGPPRR